MATSQGLPIDAMFQPSHFSVADSTSVAGSGLFQDDITFDMSRTDTSGTGISSMLADTCDWVSSQSEIVPASTSIVTAAETSFAHHYPLDHWTTLTGSRPNSASMDAPWSMAPSNATNIVPSVSELPRWTSSLSSSSSPVTTASMCEIEGSCSPELVMPPLAMSPAVYDSMSGPGSLPTDIHDRWPGQLQGYPSVDPLKSALSAVEPCIQQFPRTSMEQNGRRQSNESDPQKARSDHRYRISAGADGLYHCPIGGCEHTPDKLKCNYDKHLDSHLKPYRCKMKACQGVAFSSTACVLRHEREAHGMHGHGNKPFVCIFQECERSNPDNGFPRRWNLHDHMRRMHNYTARSGNPEDSSGNHVSGPIRSKKNCRTSPKPKVSKDETIRASSRKNGRSSLPKGWAESHACGQASSTFDMTYSPVAIDGAHVSPNTMYGPWNVLQ